MVRTVNHVEDDEFPDSSSPTESKGVGRKGNALRSKHSETEQRRRSKINERFQILRDLLPENDQKRDKASFLLEVIQYVQFLHEKIQMYEGSCQGWSPEPTQLAPLQKINSGPVESFVDQSQLETLISGHEDNFIHSPALLRNVEDSVELDFAGPALHKPIDKLQPSTNQGLSQNMSLQPPIFQDAISQQHQQSQFWRGSYLDYCSVPIYPANEEEPKTENGETSLSSVYSQGLLSSLTNALRSSGVDLSQANISVQLDIGKRTNGGSTMDHNSLSGSHSLAPVHIGDNYKHSQEEYN